VITSRQCYLLTKILTKGIKGFLNIITRLQRQKLAMLKKGSSYNSTRNIESIFCLISQFTPAFNNKKLNVWTNWPYNKKAPPTSALANDVEIMGLMLNSRGRQKQWFLDLEWWSWERKQRLRRVVFKSVRESKREEVEEKGAYKSCRTLQSRAKKNYNAQHNKRQK
jgi:hypothetical protein